MKHARLQLLTLVILFIVLSIAHVSAEELEVHKHQNSPSTDFSAALNGEKTVCSCSPYNDVLYVYNPGTVPQNFFVDVGGDAAGFITLSQNGFLLEPGQGLDVYLYGNVPCGVKGDYSLNVEVYGSLDGSEAASQVVHIVECSTSSLQTDYSSYYACPCTPITYSINVINTQASSQTYDLYVEDVDPAYYLFSKNPITLDSGDSEEVFLYMNKPCYVYGAFTHNVIARPVNGLSTATPVSMEILRACYGYNMDISELFDVSGLEEVNLDFVEAEDFQFETCENTSNVLLVKFSNPSDIINTYTLEIDSNPVINWVYMDADTVSLAAGQEYILPVYVTPPFGSEGMYTISLDAKTARGDIRDVVPVELEVVDCIGYNEESSFWKYLLLILAGLLILGILLALLMFMPSEGSEAVDSVDKEKKKTPLWLPLLLLLLLIALLIGLLSWPILNDYYEERISGGLCVEDLDSDLVQAYEGTGSDEGTTESADQERIDELEVEILDLEEQLIEATSLGDIELLNFIVEQISEREDELESLEGTETTTTDDTASVDDFDTLLAESGYTLEEFEEIYNTECSEDVYEDTAIEDSEENKYPLWLTLPLALLIPLLILLFVWLFKRRKKIGQGAKGPSKVGPWFKRWWKWLLLLLLLLLVIGCLVFSEMQYDAVSRAAGTTANVADEKWDQLMDAISSRKENQAELEELQNRIDGLAEQNENLMEYVQQNMDDREEDMEDIEEELEDISDMIEDLELEQINYEDIQSKLDSIQEDLDAVSEQLTGTTLATEESIEDLEDLIEGQGNATLQEIQELEGEVESLAEDVDAVAEDVDALEEDVAGLEEGTAALNESITEVEGEVGALGDEVSDLEEDFESTSEEVAALNETVSGLEEDVEAVEEETAATRDDLMELEEAMDEQIAALWDALYEKEEELNELEDELMDRIEEAFATAEANQEEITELDERLAEVEGDIEELIIQLEVNDVEGLEEYIASLEEQVEDLEGQVEDLEAQLEAEEEEEIDEMDAAIEEQEAIVEVPEDYKTVLLIDISVSGLIEVNGTTRFDLIKEKVYDYIDQGGKITYILVGKNPIVARKNINKFQARQFIQRLHPMDDQSRIGDSILKGAEIVGDDYGRIVVFSDFVNTVGADPDEAKEQVESEKITVVFYDIRPEMPGYEEETEEVVEETEEPVFVIEDEIIEETTVKQLYLEFEENTIYIVDLYEYFKDADQDVLTFTSSDMENVEVDIHNNIMTLKPASNWAGEESFTITADDGMGGTVTSPPIVARVTEGEESEPMDLTYLWLALGIILLLLVVIGIYVLRAVLTEKDVKKKMKK